MNIFHGDSVRRLTPCQTHTRERVVNPSAQGPAPPASLGDLSFRSLRRLVCSLAQFISIPTKSPFAATPQEVGAPPESPRSIWSCFPPLRTRGSPCKAQGYRPWPAGTPLPDHQAIITPSLLQPTLFEFCHCSQPGRKGNRRDACWDEDDPSNQLDRVGDRWPLVLARVREAHCGGANIQTLRGAWGLNAQLLAAARI